ncbi:hypothetical protein JCM10908_006026 [Rhodotorula pacifica]|uniref:uncharacterized protein n=1 Tax=Rhodotorula pacifica TaxID=1495444 RepID=UPI00317FFB70
MQPVPPPRRAATLPTLTNPHATGHPAPSPLAPAVASPAALAHHRSLVEYYWHYAQQGYAAPLTAHEGTEERRRQEMARTEAVEWARQCGIVVVDPVVRGGGSAGGVPHPSIPQGPTYPGAVASVAHSATTPAAYATTSTAPYPVAVQPFASSASPSQPHQHLSGHPLPHAIPATGPLPPIPPATMIPPANALPESAVVFGKPALVPANAAAGRPLPTPASKSVPPRAMTAPSTARSRPLPRAPLPSVPAAAATGERNSSSEPAGQLVNDLAGVQLDDDAPKRSSSPSVPVIVTTADETVTPASPAIPTFSFSTDDDPDDADASASVPAIPTFSFGLADGDEDAEDSRPVPPPSRYSSYSSPSSSSAANTRRRAPPLHPRFDPSHPSHRLYHPTSVMSPLATSAQDEAHQSRPEAGSISCSECGQVMFGRVLFALGKSWHPDCFRCAEKGCGAKLEVMEFEGTPEDWEGGDDLDNDGAEDLKGKAWCMVHFEERFALECHHCHTPIASADYIPISDPALPPVPTYRHPSTRYYHPLHFFCAGCGDPFIDPVQYETRAPSSSSSSTTPTKDKDKEGGNASDVEAKPYFAHEGHPYCDRCDLRMWRPKCPGCRKGLREEDGFLELPEEEGGGKWHEGCFKCSLCEKALTDVYMIRNMPLDPEDGAQGTRQRSSKTEKENEQEEEATVALAFCVECFDRTE